MSLDDSITQHLEYSIGSDQTGVVGNEMRIMSKMSDVLQSTRKLNEKLRSMLA